MNGVNKMEDKSKMFRDFNFKLVVINSILEKILALKQN